MNAHGRRGFTLVELLVVLVLGTLILLATYQVLATNTRVYAANSARALGQQNLRGGAAVLSGELREISPREGDLIEMGADSVRIRAQRPFGLVCAVDYSSSPVKISTFQVGPAFADGDSIFVFHDNDPDRASDDEWFGGVVTGATSNTVCSGSPSQTLSVPFVGTTASAVPPDSVRIGAPVRGFDEYVIGQYEIDGETYLGRREASAANPDPLVGPLQKSGGVSFRYLDSSGKVTNKNALVRQIEVTLRYQSDMKNFQSEPVSDSVLVRIFPRN